MGYFIISFVVIILLVVAISLVLKNAVKEVDDKSKSYFVDKLKEYDYLIDEKEKRLSELESELEKRKNGLKDNSFENGKPSYDFDTSIIDLLTETNYLDKNILAINKKIEEKFHGRHHYFLHPPASVLLNSAFPFANMGEPSHAPF